MMAVFSLSTMATGFFGFGGEEVFSEEALVEVEWLDVEGFVYPGYVVEGVFDSFR